MRTVPSVVLGEYLSDVQAIWEFTNPANGKRPLRELNDPINRGLAPYLGELYGDQVAYGYIRDLLIRAEAQRRAEAKARWQQKRAQLSAPTHEEATPKRKVKRNDAAYNERRMRDALLAEVGPNGWTKAGIRELARRAGNMPHRTARDTLARMARDGQVELDHKWGQGKPTGVHVLLDHPCWSDPKHAQQRAKSRLSSQVRW
jgi:hypothetical protein